VVLDLLTKKGQHVEQFIGFASKPRLLARFRERMEEYKRFWEGISIMCANYVIGIQTANESSRMYGFLEKSNSSGMESTTTASGGSGKYQHPPQHNNNPHQNHGGPHINQKESSDVDTTTPLRNQGGDSFDSLGSNNSSNLQWTMDALDDFKLLNMTPKN
jgi:hypothetical protein